jgi:hypothetical protein
MTVYEAIINGHVARTESAQLAEQWSEDYRVTAYTQ